MITCTGLLNYAEALICIDMRNKEERCASNAIIQEENPIIYGHSKANPDVDSRLNQAEKNADSTSTRVDRGKIWVDKHGPLDCKYVLPMITLANEIKSDIKVIMENAWRCYQTSGWNDLTDTMIAQDRADPAEVNEIGKPCVEEDEASEELFLTKTLKETIELKKRREAIKAEKIKGPYDRNAEINNARITKIFLYLFCTPDHKIMGLGWDKNGNYKYMTLSVNSLTVEIYFNPTGVVVKRLKNVEDSKCTLL